MAARIGVGAVYGEPGFHAGPLEPDREGQRNGRPGPVPDRPRSRWNGVFIEEREQSIGGDAYREALGQKIDAVEQAEQDRPLPGRLQGRPAPREPGGTGEKAGAIAGAGPVSLDRGKDPGPGSEEPAQPVLDQGLEIARRHPPAPGRPGASLADQVP